MATSIKTVPKTLNEWTLELNIAHEIADMFNTPLGILYPKRLRKMFDILSVDFHRLTRKKTKLYKLTPAEEGAGGGWDTKVVVPRAFGADDRVVYLQFKSGSHSDGNNIVGSRFNISIKNPNKCIEFTFNDNDNPARGKAATQHDDLKRLNTYLVNQGFSDKSVMYAFPRISDLSSFEQLQEPLILYTTFLSVNQMDAEAASKGVNLHDGKRHYFRSCYSDEKNREISSTPFTLELPDESQSVLHEIMTVKLARIWDEFYYEINAERLKDYLRMAVSEYLKVNPYDIISAPFDFYTEDEGYDFNSFFDQLKDKRQNNELEVFSQSDANAFADKRASLYKSVHDFIYNLEEASQSKDIPQHYSNILVNQDYFPQDMDFGDINVTSIVF